MSTILEEGAHYRVTKEGAQLSGWKPIAPYTQSGCRFPLNVGDVIRYRGMEYSGGSDGIPVHHFELAGREHPDAPFARDFSPLAPDVSSIWDTRPDLSFLERQPVTEKER